MLLRLVKSLSFLQVVSIPAYFYRDLCSSRKQRMKISSHVLLYCDNIIIILILYYNFSHKTEGNEGLHIYSLLLFFYWFSKKCYPLKYTLLFFNKNYLLNFLFNILIFSSKHIYYTLKNKVSSGECIRPCFREVSLASLPGRKLLIIGPQFSEASNNQHCRHLHQPLQWSW